MFHVITGRHFLYKFVVTQSFGTTSILLHSLKQEFWKKSAFYVCYLHSSITILLILKVQNRGSTSLFVDSALFTLSVSECSICVLINGIFKTQKFKCSLGACFFIKRCTQVFMIRYLFLQIRSNKWEHLLYIQSLRKCYKAYVAYIECNTK